MADVNDLQVISDDSWVHESRIQFRMVLRGGGLRLPPSFLLVNPFCFNLICKTDTREEVMEYDKNAVGVFKSADPETLVGHLPI